MGVRGKAEEQKSDEGDSERGSDGASQWVEAGWERQRRVGGRSLSRYLLKRGHFGRFWANISTVNVSGEPLSGCGRKPGKPPKARFTGESEWRRAHQPRCGRGSVPGAPIEGGAGTLGGRRGNQGDDPAELSHSPIQARRPPATCRTGGDCQASPSGGRGERVRRDGVRSLSRYLAKRGRFGRIWGNISTVNVRGDASAGRASL